MSENKNDKKSSVGKGKKKYELSLIDVRFLRVVDEIIEKNKIEKIEPNTDSSISKIIFGDRYAISKIRSSHRGVTLNQVEKTAIFFNLDSNCFFREIDKIEYDPNNIGSSNVIRDKAQINYGNGNINTVSGDNNETNFHGDNHYYGEIKKQVKHIHNIINKSECSSKLQKKYHSLLEKIQDESTNLEKMLDEKTNELKKMADLLVKETLDREKAEKERDIERVEKEKIKDKYIALLERAK
jgi:hypothetical protein